MFTISALIAMLTIDYRTISVLIVIALLCKVLFQSLLAIDYKFTITQGARTLTNKTISVTSEMGTDLALDPLATGNSVTKNISFAGDDLQSLVILSDQDLTFKVNDDGTPDLTVSLLADEPYVWINNGYITNPLAGVTVTSFKFTNASGSTANITAYVQYDPGA